MMNDAPYDVEAEIALLVGIAKGDQDAFAAFYDRYSAVLFSIAFRVLNDQTGAQDVLQDVFLQIWAKASTYDPARGKPLTWAVTMTRNKAIDRLRSRQRRARLKDEVERETMPDDPANSRVALDEVLTREKGEMVRAAVKDLPDEQRKAIEMAFFSGLTQTEIAEKLGAPLGTIKARIRRGMMKLRDAMDRRL